jgi:hypothetical protein
LPCYAWKSDAVENHCSDRIYGKSAKLAELTFHVGVDNYGIVEDCHQQQDGNAVGSRAGLDRRPLSLPHHLDKGFEGEIAELKTDCDCRKPKMGMFERAARDWKVSLSKSYGVGAAGPTFSRHAGWGFERWA